MTTIDYDQAAADYASNRGIFPPILDALAYAAARAERVLEVGCGSGNYAGALQSAIPAQVVGCDPSNGMLAHARRSLDAICAARGEALPFAAGTFDLVFTVDVIHHIRDVAPYFRESHRVLRPGGNIGTATDSERIIATRQPLAVYWPETVEVELRRYHRVEDLRGWMETAGFRELREEPVEHGYLLTDLQPYRDRAYSTLRLIPEEAWRRGLARLEADMARGPVMCVARYVLLWGQA
jgi:SAM-dependent methyltransferase